MKLNRKNLKQLIREALSDKGSVLLESPVEEATMSSIQDRVHAGDAYSDRPERTAEEFIVMSSDRGEREPAENKRLYLKFKGKIKSAGFSFTEFIGKWIETDKKTGEERVVKENSVIIYSDKRPDVPEQQGELFELAKALSVEFKQEAFIYGELASARGGKTRVIQAFDDSGNVLNWGGPWSSIEAVKSDEEFWSQVRGGGKGSAFQFKENKDTIEVEAPDSVIEAMKRASENPGKKVKFVRSRRRR